MKFEIIDFHTHPFLTDSENICSHKSYCDMSVENTVNDLKSIGISKICGSVIKLTNPKSPKWEDIKELNDIALKLRELYKDFYIPGFAIHPAFVEESCAEIERMSSLGINLIGEIVPYMHGWNSYYSKEFSEILDAAEKYNMILNIHSSCDDEMDIMVKEHPDLVIVAAHPGEITAFNRHMERMKMSKNYYLDLSGTGLFRHGMLRHAIDLFGPERFLFGSDYPICNPGMFIGGIEYDFNLTDKEKEQIFSKNAKRLLNLK